MDNSIIGLVKTGAGMALGAGVGVVVGNIVKATTPVELTRYQKLLVAVGTMGLSGVIADAASRRLEDRIDNAVVAVKALFTPTTVEQGPGDEVNPAADEVADDLDKTREQVKKAVEKADPDGPKLSDDHK